MEDLLNCKVMKFFLRSGVSVPNLGFYIWSDSCTALEYAWVDVEMMSPGR
jgi:hypothetical protein